MPKDQQLVWPTPPHQGYADAQAKRASSDCLIAFFDGRKLFGNILRFLPQEEMIEFRPMQGGKVLQVVFNEIKNLRLIRPVALRSRDVKLTEKGAEVVEVSSNQKFTVEFRAASGCPAKPEDSCKSAMDCICISSSPATK